MSMGLLPSVMDMASLSLKLFARLFRDSSRDLCREIFDLLVKSDKVLAIFWFRMSWRLEIPGNT